MSDQREQLKNLQRAHSDIWQMYLTWFSWFFGINIAALAGAFAATRLGPSMFRGLAFLMIFCGILGIIASILMARFSRDARRLSKKLSAANSAIVDVMFGGRVLQFAPIATTAVLLATLVTWAYAAYQWSMAASGGCPALGAG